MSVRVNHLSAGMIPVEDVLHPLTHQVLAKAGAPLTAQAIALVARVGLREIPIAAGVPNSMLPLPAAPPAPPPPPPSIAAPPPGGAAFLRRTEGAVPSKAVFPAKELEPAVQQVLARNLTSMRELDQEFVKTAKLDIAKVDRCVVQTIQDIVQNPEVMKHFNELRRYDCDATAHSTNVMNLALLVGMSLGYSYEQLRVLGTGALLHDLGQHGVPTRILNKPSKLNEQEYSIVQTHTEYSARILRNHGWASQELVDIVLLHHEKYNGGGYPKHLKGKDIPEMAQIVSVVDVYDALVSNRSYRQAIPPHQVYQFLIDGINSLFAPRIVWAFQKHIVPYPANAQVLLNSGQVAKIVQVNRTNPMKPVVELDGQVLDLAQHPRLLVENLYIPGDPRPPLTRGPTGPLPS